MSLEAERTWDDAPNEELEHDGRPRRVLSLILPHLLEEIAERRRAARGAPPAERIGTPPRSGRGGSVRALPTPEAAAGKDRASPKRGEPRGFVFTRSADRAVEASDVLTEVNSSAYELGIRPGQTVTEAQAWLGRLEVERVTVEEVEHALLEIVEQGARYGTSVGYERRGEAHPDTVWIDVTGSARLFSGEARLAEDLLENVRLLGHSARVVITEGPLLGRALGRWTTERLLVVEPHRLGAFLRDLPLCALPLEEERSAWFTRLGILTVGQLLELPLAETTARLGPRAPLILRLARGEDTTPLCPLNRPRFLEESWDWDEPTSGVSPVLFAARRLLGRLATRLQTRGEAAFHLEARLKLDGARPVRVSLELGSPLWREAELERALRARLEKLELTAGVVGLSITLDELTEARAVQLGVGPEGADELAELPLLLLELEAEVGPSEVGRLVTRDRHKPEERSALVPWKKPLRAPEERPLRALRALDRVTRLFSPPLPLPDGFGSGAQFVWGKQLYTVRRLELVERLRAVEWWTEHATSRDYFWAWLESKLPRAEGGRAGAKVAVQALVYAEGHPRCFFLQGFRD